jgi:hypothetical protein
MLTFASYRGEANEKDRNMFQGQYARAATVCRKYSYNYDLAVILQDRKCL